MKDQLEDVLDKYFPKGECQERGAALVLFAEALRLAKEAVESEKGAWLAGLRCDNCGEPKRYTDTSSMCEKCWEEE